MSAETNNLYLMKEKKENTPAPRTRKGRRSSQKPAKAKSLSPWKCPEGMSLKEWQKGLRRQAAIKENLGITPPAEGSEYFIVKNPRTQQVYRVFYKGARSKWNFCSCRDFSTNHLGTCKHIEAITAAQNGAYAEMRFVMPDYSAVYIDYRSGREVKIRVGSFKKNEFHELAQQYFDKNGTLLPESFAEFDAFIRQARELDPRFVVYDDALDYIIEQREAVSRAKELEQGIMADGQPLVKATLYNYQAEGVEFAFRAGRSIISDEMGLGKTIQAIATAMLLNRKGFVDSVLVLCPTSLKYQWKKEIERFTDATVSIVEGNPTQRKAMYNGPEFFKIVSYNSISNDIAYGVRPPADMLIFDEIQRLKNWDTKIARNLRHLHSRYVVALSGTPLENKLSELYSVMNFVNPFALGPYYQFNDDFVQTDETGRIVGYKNLNKVAEKIAPVLIRRRRSEVALQMPERTDTNLFVPLTMEQADIHDGLKADVARLVAKWHTHHFLSESDRRKLLLSLSMMRMVCDSTFVLDQKTKFGTKVDELMHIIREVVDSDDDKIVVFSQWERMQRLVCEALDREGIKYSFLHGSVPARKRKAMIDGFQSDPEIRVFLSTDAGSTGLNLQSASFIVNLDLPWNPAVLEQRISRIQRIGQTKPVSVINMVSRDSIEERMLQTLKFKSDLIAGVFDNGEDNVFIDNNKLNRIIEIVDEQPEDVEAVEVDGAPTRPARPSITSDENEETSSRGRKEKDAQDASAPDVQETVADGDEPTDDASQDVAQKTPAETQPRRQQSEKLPEPVSGDQLIVQGLTFLSGLAQALKTPESTRELVDTIVKTDKKTGRATLSLPVPDKELVANLLTALGKLINNN